MSVINSTGTSAAKFEVGLGVCYCVNYPAVLKIGEYPRIFPSFCWGIFTHVRRLDQSRTNENI